MASEAAAGPRVDKVIQLVATSSSSWEDAARVAIAEAAKTIRDLDRAVVLEADIFLDQVIPTYRVKLEISFQLDRTRVDNAGVSTQVRRYLVLANQTLPSGGLADLVRAKVAESPSEFHVVVPHSTTAGIYADPATGIVGPSLTADALEATRLEAHARLGSFLHSLAELGSNLSGEVVAGDPVNALRHVLARSSFDEIIVSTLPAGISRWLSLDVPSRIERASNLPVTTLVRDN